MSRGAVFDSALEAVDQYCHDRTPEHLRSQIRLEAQAGRRGIVIVERRPPWTGPDGQEWTSNPIARLLHDPSADSWTLQWIDSSDRRHTYAGARPSSRVEGLLKAIESDRSGVFFG